MTSRLHEIDKVVGTEVHNISAVPRARPSATMDEGMGQKDLLTLQLYIIDKGVFISIFLISSTF